MSGAAALTQGDEGMGEGISAIWQGSVRHRRFAPRAHAFSYSLFMLGLDLDAIAADPVGVFGLALALTVVKTGVIFSLARFWGLGARPALETALGAAVDRADAAAQARGARVVPVGHLPTISEDLFADEAWRAPGARYEALESSVMEARGEEITLRIEGEGRGVDTTFDSIAPESACTSMQLHLQVPPEPISKLVRCLKGSIFDVAVDDLALLLADQRSQHSAVVETVPHRVGLCGGDEGIDESVGYVRMYVDPLH